MSKLKQLSVDVEEGFQKFMAIQEPLQKPFSLEALTRRQATSDDGQIAVREEILLEQSFSDFDSLYQDKTKILDTLWQEWEDLQFDIICLAAELFGSDAVRAVRQPNEDFEMGQLNRLNLALRDGEKGPRGVFEDHAKLQEDLETLEQELGQIISKVTKDANTVHQVPPVRTRQTFPSRR
jgi:hypothetical protein